MARHPTPKDSQEQSQLTQKFQKVVWKIGWTGHKGDQPVRLKMRIWGTKRVQAGSLEGQGQQGPQRLMVDGSPQSAAPHQPYHYLIRFPEETPSSCGFPRAIGSGQACSCHSYSSGGQGDLAFLILLFQKLKGSESVTESCLLAKAGFRAQGCPGEAQDRRY